MIDHVLGRPSLRSRKVQVFAAVSFWSFYLYKGNNHGPPLLRRLSNLLSPRLTAWQTVVITLLWLYISRNFGKLVGLECPEPLANLYTRSYFRATWITTALDAGFWSAMRVRNKMLRDLLSVICSGYYLICAEQADEKVRKIRSVLTVDHLRISWNKGTTPYLGTLSRLLRPRLMRYGPRKIRIPRPSNSSYNEPVMGWLYWDGSLAALKKQKALVLDIPGGGWVAMDPRNHDDKLLGWAAKSRLPVLSLDYRKAPEYPYPYALNECFDVYQSIVITRGRCIGLSGETVPRIIVAGDSAGGNLAVGVVLMVLQSGTTETRRFLGEHQLPAPEGVALIYPALDMNIGNWMTDEQMGFIRERRVRKTNEGVLRRKTDQYKKLDPATPIPSDDEDSGNATPRRKRKAANDAQPRSTGTAIFTGGRSSSSALTPIPKESKESKDTDMPRNSVLSPPQTATGTSPSNGEPTSSPSMPAPQVKTRVMVSSLLSYFSDRIITPEMMRAMIILYIGPHHRPDFAADFLLSPVLAPDSLLARFPRTFFLTGERDPLVDDTVIFAGRIRQAKRAVARDREEMGLEVSGPGRRKRRSRNPSKDSEDENDDEEEEEEEDPDWVKVVLIPGISHGFLQFVAVFPEGWKLIFGAARWMRDVIDDAEYNEGLASGTTTPFATSSPTLTKISVADSRRPERSNGSTALQRDARIAETNMTLRLPQRKLGNSKFKHVRSDAASSEDEERPLEMSRIKRSSPASASPSIDSSLVESPSSGIAHAISSNSTDQDDTVSSSSSMSHSTEHANGITTATSTGGDLDTSQLDRVKDRVTKGDKTARGLKSGGRRRRRSSTLRALTSEEDLLGRRMLGLTGRLTRGGDDAPPTP